MNEIPKLIASDIGGTLLTKSKIFPDFTARVLNLLVLEEKIPVVLITGYNFSTTLNYTANLSDKIILMPQNGSLCVKERKLVSEFCLPEEAIQSIYRYLESKNLPVIFYKGQKGDFKNFYRGAADFRMSSAFERVTTVSDFSGYTGISTRIPNEEFIRIRDAVKEMIGDNFQLIVVREQDETWIEILHEKVRKDLALQRLTADLSISLADVIYFGDNFNDLEVLRIVGHPVLVGNAVPELKREFNTIIQPVSSQGVALYLNDLYNLNLN